MKDKSLNLYKKSTIYKIKKNENKAKGQISLIQILN